jgi:hypothetical protein
MIQHYRRMADDPHRLSLMQQAIAAEVHPGDIVADVGCGLGTFSIFACRAGARRVYAIEEQSILEVAREVARANGCADRIVFLAGRSTELQPPEPVQVAIFEDYPSTLVNPLAVQVLRDLTTRWLTADGRLVPSRARLLAALVEDEAGYREIDCLAKTGDSVCGVDFRSTRPRTFSTPHARRLPENALLAAPVRIGEYRLAELGEAAFRAAGSLSAARDGTAHGLLLWFELGLGGEWLGTGPLSPPSPWTQTLFPLEPPIRVAAGTSVQWSLEAAPLGNETLFRWAVAANGERVEADSFSGMPLRWDFVERSRGALIPEPCPDFDIDRAILRSANGRRTVRQIARRVQRRFPENLPDVAAAAERVVTVLGRHPGTSSRRGRRS